MTGTAAPTKRRDRFRQLHKFFPLRTAANQTDSALQKAFNATQEKQNLCQNKRWTFTFGEHTVRLAQEADKILLWLDRFKSVGDIASYQRSSLTRAFDAFWKPKEMRDFEDECERIATQVETEASNCDRTLSACEREEANLRKEHLQRVLEELEELQDIKESVSVLESKIDLATLPTAKSAALNSYVDELDARCHPDTRIDLRHQIREWAEDSQDKCIFWLNGMAGTGKSTISRTIAQSLDNDGQLGASFFFKRGEGERGNASRFFTTITAQLLRRVPAMIPHVRNTINTEPEISEKSLKEQFEKLIFQPLSQIRTTSTQASTLVIVVDALDECEREGDMSSDTHQDVILQDIPQITIKHDISAFLRYGFTKIREDYNCLHPSDALLPSSWPGEEHIRALTEMALPLFIFAATVCRFVGDPKWNPKNRLTDVLKYQMSRQASMLDKTYLPVLNQLLIDLTDSEKESLAQEFLEIVGSVVVLADPLSTSSLAGLLGIDIEIIYCRPNSPHPILSIPPDRDSPVRLLHLSFRDFLLDPEKRGKSSELSRFLYDARCFVLQNRGMIDTAPLHLYSSAIIFAPETSIIRHMFKDQIPKWIRRLPKMHSTWSPELQKLEGHTNWATAIAFSHNGQLLASASWDKAVRLWNPATGEELQKLKGHTSPVNAVAFSHDGQLLASASRDKTVRLWNPATGEELQKLKGHSGLVNAVAFSHNGQLLASASWDEAVRLWNLVTGEKLQKLEGHTGPKHWFTRDLENLLWLPPEYRPIRSAFQNNVFTLWCPSSILTFVEFR
ncbi:uncharacterized protein K441DRAFT_702856 [Cenococcum geophilum 1.58]|uniref:uncharacterized protein n=1 Tax=Cenococcum geophilum 1.58 TaxID=794803 RepID=UPI00358FB6DE|nr:hypothetical protein K441DRAFT_702856 [Cenococcum geophilum 1.58]